MKGVEFMGLLEATVAIRPVAARAQPPELVRRISLVGNGAAQSSGIFVLDSLLIRAYRVIE